MAPLITRIVETVVPGRSASIGDCLVCTRAVRDDGRGVRLARGGYVHRDCATYRMRRSGTRPVVVARRSRNDHTGFTGE